MTVPNINEIFNVLKNIKLDEITPSSERMSSDEPKKPSLRFGPGFKPLSSKGVSPATRSTTLTSEGTSKEDMEYKPTHSGLRGSGLKIADK